MSNLMITGTMNKLNAIVRKVIIMMTFVLMMCSQARAQFEPQFTQYMFNEMFINPAYAGSRDHMAMTALYRNQWVGIEGSPKTQTFSAHTPLRNEKIGLGLSILHEEIGVTQDFSAFGTYAYRIPMQKGFFSMALSGGIIHHQEQLLELKTQDQGDQSFMGTPRLTVPNMGFGTFLSTRNYYVGLSIPRMLQNKVDAATGKAENKINVPYWHYYLMGGYVFTLNESVKLKPTCMVKAVSGAPVVADFGAHVLLSEVLWLGGSYRTSDSWAAILQIQMNKQMRLGYSYDYTLTELNQFTSGTHEITLGFDFSFDKNKVVTPRYF
ncbi:MAG: type IX secretion system membrane protein PorP/SprF [Bacteroidetes bacterium]|nr:type IX secretion system membrane protein PorP/SprF [Bacteroidota bacterium]